MLVSYKGVSAKDRVLLGLEDRPRTRVPKGNEVGERRGLERVVGLLGAKGVGSEAVGVVRLEGEKGEASLRSTRYGRKRRGVVWEVEGAKKPVSGKVSGVSYVSRRDPAKSAVPRRSVSEVVRKGSEERKGTVGLGLRGRNKVRWRRDDGTPSGKAAMAHRRDGVVLEVGLESGASASISEASLFAGREAVKRAYVREGLLMGRAVKRRGRSAVGVCKGC